MYIKSIFSCPVCGKELKFDERSYKCESGHCFDRSKSGYVNLLTSDKMHSKLFNIFFAFVIFNDFAAEGISKLFG